MKMTLVELEEQLRQLKDMEEKTPNIFKQLDNEFWIVRALKDLYEMACDYNQTEVPDFSNGDFVAAKRVIKSNAYVDAFHLQKNKIDSTMFCGLFVAVDGYFVSNRLMEKVFNRMISKVASPTQAEFQKYNLPTSGLRYETIRQVHSGGYGFLLADNEANKPFRSWNYWEFMDI